MHAGEGDRYRPLTPAEFAALMAPFEPFESRPGLAVAVSGGRDSVCLVLLAGGWVAARGGSLVGLIVDHGLRQGSSAEAAGASCLLGRLGIDSEILAWEGPKPQRRLQEQARTARYDLLSEACRRRGLLHLLVAHHAADQAETVAMRAARGSGPDGLAGMAAVAERRDVRLLRPLLGVPRERLTATLVARGIAWVDDPSNTDPRFERARLREAGLAVAGVGAAERRAEKERQLAEAAVAALEVDPDGTIAIDCATIAGLPHEMVGRLLGRIVQAFGARDYPPRRDRLGRAVARLFRGPDRGRSGKGQDFTLSGCHLMLRKAPASARLRWIVRAESGRKYGRNGGLPLVPAAFSACDGPGATHLH